MNLWQAAVFGIVEGVTEFLPISSTGHLMLTAKAFGLAQTEFMKSFEIAIQVGAIFAVMGITGKRFFLRPQVWGKVFAAFVPTAIIGLVFYKLIKGFFLSNEQVVLWALFLGGILIILFERFHREKEGGPDDIAMIPWKTCVLIGFFQAAAVVPGVSRAAATILGGLFLGLRRKTIVEFSFLLAVPTLLAASALDLMKTAHGYDHGEWALLGAGFITSLIAAMFVIKLFLFYIQKNNFTLFGVYRIVLSLIFWGICF